MNIIKKIENEKITLFIEGQFNFNSIQTFKKQTTEILENKNINLVIIDFEKITYIDSSGLGALLLLREKINEKKKKLNLVKIKGVVLDIFLIANFQKIFSINEDNK